MTRPLRTTLGAAIALGAAVAALSLGQEVAPPPRPLPTAEDKARRELEVRTHAPGAYPDRVILTFASDPATTQAVTWRTSTEIAEGWAEIAISEGGPKFAQGGKPARIRARTQLLKTGLNDAHYHSANFTNLRAKTKYVYRVGDGRQNWSEWFQFETAADRPEPFGFIYFGDAQNDLKSHWSRVARGAFSDMPKARFIVHAGDLINNRDDDAQWGEWHRAGGWINGMVPSAPVPGNHEYAKTVDPHWRAQFSLPENGPAGLEETAYSFDYQGVRFIAMNTEEKVSEQAAWLEGLLASNPNRWTVVAFHRPIYSPLKNRDNKSIRDAWRPVFDRAPKGVDLVLQGHDHTYGRSGLMRDDNTLAGGQVHTERGTVYCVSVSGPKNYSVGDLPWMVRKGEGRQLYQLIRVNGDRLSYESRDATGELFDAFELKKRSDGGNELIEKGPSGAESDSDSEAGYGHAAAAAAILGLLAAGIGWALRSVTSNSTR
jgi:3',5'-cyclic AMP phosphodiesterase CpdA